MKSDSGVALIAVLAGLMVLSAVAVGLAVSVQTEARIEAADFDALQAEQLARSGQELALLLQARGLARGPDLLAGLPIEAVAAGFHYRAQLSAGTVDIYFEADNGKLDLTAAAPEVLTNFFTLWGGDLSEAQLITAAISDWRDADNETSLGGAEAPFYAGSDIAPRNGPLGVADAAMIRGLSLDDFRLKYLPDGAGTLRPGLDAYITSAGAGRAINPNFASELVLRSIPGLSESHVASIISRRAERPFADANDLQARAGISPDSPSWSYLTVDGRGTAVRTLAKLKSNGITRSERRVTYGFAALNAFTGVFEPKSAIGRIERNGFLVDLHGL